MYGQTPFLELLEGIESIETYNFNPEAIRLPQKPSPGSFLERDGSNLGSVIETTREITEWAVERAGRYLLAITKTAEFTSVVRAATKHFAKKGAQTPIQIGYALWFGVCPFFFPHHSKSRPVCVAASSE